MPLITKLNSLQRTIRGHWESKFSIILFSLALSVLVTKGNLATDLRIYEQVIIIECFTVSFNKRNLV